MFNPEGLTERKGGGLHHQFGNSRVWWPERKDARKILGLRIRVGRPSLLVTYVRSLDVDENEYMEAFLKTFSDMEERIKFLVWIWKIITK